MSEINHTPGPWIWGNNYCGLYGAGPDNEVLDYAGYEGMWVAHHINRDANARLIAAAPELLDAVKKLHRELYACQAVIHLAGGFDPAYVKGAQEAIKNADAAIAKATGA